MSSEKPSYKTGKELLDSLEYNFKGILLISEFIKSPLKPLLFKVGVAIWGGLIIAIFFLKVPVYPLIVEIKNLLISLLPGILGFTIGGYSILIGFTQPGLVEKITDPMKGSKYSLYQLASASFACNILIQAAVLLFAYGIHFVCWIDANKKVGFTISVIWGDILNYFTLAAILLGFIFAALIILQLISNIFNFSQLYHYNINKGKLEKEKESGKK